MDFNRLWTIFALDAEVDAIGTSRICDAHNTLRSQLAERDAEVERLTELLRLETERSDATAFERDQLRLRTEAAEEPTDA